MTPEMKRDLIVTLANKDYVSQAKQLFSSVYYNAGWSGDYMLLAYDVSDADLKWFRTRGVLVKECDRIPNRIKGLWGDIIVCKLYLFTPEFKQWARVVYVDADTIVRAPLSDILNVAQLSAVRDGFLGNRLIDQFVHPREFAPDVFGRFVDKFNVNVTSFNSGFFVFNTNIVTDGTFGDLMRLLEEYQDVFKPWNGDQPVLNLYFYSAWKELPITYNLDFRDFNYVRRERLHPIVLHFIEDNKPWNQDNPFYAEWKSNLDEADDIDFTRQPVGWQKKYGTSHPLYFNFVFYLRYRNILKVLDRKIGMLGLFLYRKYPKLYNSLKFFRDA